MAEYIIDQTKTGRWYWACKNDDENPEYGYANTKSDAKQAAEEACGENNIIITPPKVTIEQINGYPTILIMENLFGHRRKFSVLELTENIFY